MSLSRSTNLDPALAGSDQARYRTERSNDTFTTSTVPASSYRPDGSQAASSYAAAQPAQPYYQQHLGQSSAESSLQQSPASQSCVQHSLGSGTGISPGGDSASRPQEDDQSTQDESKRQRACEACRGLKVRCDQDPLRPDMRCKRCAKAGRPCVITEPSRKRQKKADSRVAELERKLDALTAALEGRQTSGGISTSNQQQRHNPVSVAESTTDEPVRHIKQCDSIYEATPTNAKRKRLDEATLDEGRASSTLISVASNGEQPTSAYNDRSADEWRATINALVPFEQSAELFRRYNEVMSPYCPMVVFPHGTAAEQIFGETPILYLAIITASSGGVLPADLPMKLQQECVGAIADCVVRNGEKSLELIQAMLVLSVWYKPPARAEQTNFYQILHMAAIMSLDIGLGRRSGSRKTRTPFNKYEVAFSTKQTSLNPDALEARRAWLGCYYLCATASMVLRRPNLVRWTDYMKDCIEVLETSPDAHPSDKLLCQHIKIQHICEDIGLQFLMDDSTASVNINDPKVTYALVTLENQLKAWKQQVPVEAQCASLTFFEHVTSLYLHEIALHFNHNIEDFRLPFTVESVKNVHSSSDALTQAQVAATEACLNAAHGILTTFIGFTTEEILALPLLLFFVRCVYALVILIRMHMSINTPESELGKLMKSTDLKIAYFMDAMIDQFEKISRMNISKPDKALAILRILRQWFLKHKNGPKQGEESTSEPAAEQATHAKLAQTPLHMLSQVASGQQNAAATQDDHADWTFKAPSMVGFRRPASGHPYNTPPRYSRAQDASALQQDSSAYTANMLGMDASNPLSGYSWVPGVEQAMDMTLGHMGDLQAGGLDSWFLGDGIAPFAFNDGTTSNVNEAMAQW